ncbi:MAG TPA: HDOD domain-containing protein [Myxococcota bacterium]
MKALFVDDDPVVLGALRRGLMARPDTGDCQFAYTVTDALAALERDAFDAVVCDISMRGLDGATLLQQVADLHPGALRVILSAASDDTAVLRAAPVAHEFVSKQADVGVVVETIRRGLERREQMGNGTGITALIGRIGALPAPPDLFVRLDEVTADPNASSASVSAVLQGAPVVVARLLQLVNSSFFASPSPIVTLDAAIARLGLRLVRAVVLADGLFADDGNGVYSTAHQRRGRFEAAAAMTAAQAISMRGASRETAVTAALLANIGVPLLATVAPELATWIRDRVDAGADQLATELEVLGTTHAAFAGHVLAAWNLPPDVVSAVAHHHARPTTWDAQAIVCTAWQITEKKAVDIEALRDLGAPSSSLAMVRELVGART